MAASFQREARLAFPTSRSLPAESWDRRHRGILWLLVGHAAGLMAFGFYMGTPLTHTILEPAAVAAIALVAAWPRLARRARSIVAAFGLMSASGILVHMSGGYIEAHFHFFVMLGVIFLYEDWLPYVLAVGYVAVHHGVVGTLDPASVFNHPGGFADPWMWAAIHALFILGLSAAMLVAWNVIERARVSETRALTEAQDLKRQLHAQEKMAALGSLVSGLAHEVRTPLTIVATSAAILDISARKAPDDPLSPTILAQTSQIQMSVERMNALVLQLRRFHALTADELAVAPLDGVVRDALRLFSSANKSTQLQVDLEPTPPAKLHALGIHQVVINLLTNAVEATVPATGSVTVRTRADARHAVLIVEDNGGGMTDEAQRRAFDPLFTTKRDGMGLGLHIVKRIVDAHGGDVSFSTKPGAGTVFTVRFPLTRPPEPVAIPVDRAAPAATAPA